MIFNKNILLLAITITLFCVNTANLQATNYTKKDSVIYQRYITESSMYETKPINELLILTAKYFLGSPYIGATLEIGEEEDLTINLREFDCTTFVESCIALTQEAERKDGSSFSSYMESLKRIRYRDGTIDSYTSRLHYPSDWLYENSDILEDITADLGGVTTHKPLSFMSSKPHLYPRLKDNETNQLGIKQIEENINKRDSYTLLPVSKIKQAEKNIKTGDIIIFGTTVKGLDYSHIGFALWENDTLKLLHASSAHKKVIVDPKDLVHYCESSKTCTGITVLRLKDNIVNR